MTKHREHCYKTIFLIAGMLLIIGLLFPLNSSAVFKEGYIETFDKAKGTIPLKWRSGHNHAHIICTDKQQGEIKLDHGYKYGDVISPTFHKEEKFQYKELSYDIIELASESYIDIVLQEEMMPYRTYTLFEKVNQPGHYKKDISQFLSSDNIKFFTIKIWLNGEKAPWIVLDSIQLTKIKKNKNRPAGSSDISVDYIYINNKVNGVVWKEEFNGEAKAQPDNWWDSTNDRTFNTELEYSNRQSKGLIYLGSVNHWGKVQSPNIKCDFSKDPSLEIKIDHLSPGTKWRLSIQEINGKQWRQWFLEKEETAKTGTFTYDCSEIVKLSSNDLFRIEVMIANPEKGKRKVDSPKPPVEKNTQAIVIGVDERIGKDFEQIYRVKQVVNPVLEYAKKQLKLPVQLVCFDNASIKRAYEEGEIDIILSYDDYFKKVKKGNYLYPYLTVRKNGICAQRCNMYVRTDSLLKNPEELKHKRIAVSDVTVRDNLGKTIYPQLREFDSTDYFGKTEIEDNVRDQIIALQFGTVDAIVGYEFIEDVAQGMGVSLIKIASSEPIPHLYAYGRKSKNEFKNKQMKQLQKNLLASHQNRASQSMFKLFNIDGFEKPAY